MPITGGLGTGKALVPKPSPIAKRSPASSSTPSSSSATSPTIGRCPAQCSSATRSPGKKLAADVEKVGLHLETGACRVGYVIVRGVRLRLRGGVRRRGRGQPSRLPGAIYQGARVATRRGLPVRRIPVG
jgi:hypothetical protein